MLSSIPCFSIWLNVIVKAMQLVIHSVHRRPRVCAERLGTTPECIKSFGAESQGLKLSLLLRQLRLPQLSKVAIPLIATRTLFTMIIASFDVPS